jgi:hypothetical protein
MSGGRSETLQQLQTLRSNGLFKIIIKHKIKGCPFGQPFLFLYQAEND